MKRAQLAALLLTATCLSAHASESSAPDDIVGVWLTEHSEGKIEMFRCGSKYCGKTVWISKKSHSGPEEKRDIHNPDPAKRNDKIIGKTIFWNLTYDTDENEYVHGMVYDPDRGKTYKCKAWLEGKNTLLVRGFLGISLLGQTTKWTRVTRP